VTAQTPVTLVQKSFPADKLKETFCTQSPQTRLDVAVGATVWNCPARHTVSAAHCDSVTGMVRWSNTTDSYCVA